MVMVPVMHDLMVMMIGFRHRLAPVEPAYIVYRARRVIAARFLAGMRRLMGARRKSMMVRPAELLSFMTRLSTPYPMPLPTSLMLPVMAPALMAWLMTVMLASLELLRGAMHAANGLTEGSGAYQRKIDCDKCESERITSHTASWIPPAS